jgi:hypothetical protein
VSAQDRHNPARTIALAPWCEESHHDLSAVSDKELITGQLRCGCWIEGDRAARMLKARRLAEVSS